MTTRLITQTLSRQSPTDIMDEALDGEEVSFRLPWEVKRDKLGHLETVDSKVGDWSSDSRLFALFSIEVESLILPP